MTSTDRAEKNVGVPFQIKKLAVIGAGGMGSMMTLLFAENGASVIIEDPSDENRKEAIQNARDIGFGEEKVRAAKNYKEIFEFLGHESPRLLVFSLPNGPAVDSVISQLRPYLKKGDIVLDCSNENWQRTERRQGELVNINCHFVGCGVSGGYQSARAGPSMCPGGDETIVRRLLPWMEQVAAKDAQGRSCVRYIGAGGAGHYVKMIHNGIEQGMMGTLCEVWFIMHHGLGMPYEEISEVFKEWESDGQGELRDNFLISIGVDICKIKDPKDGQYVLSKVKDKVVQDVDETEGTGYWTIQTAADLHVPLQTITAAHNFRIASADAQRRADVQKAFSGPLATPSSLEVADKKAFLESLRLATFGAFLSSFCQGMEVIRLANKRFQMDIDFSSVVDIWRAGCIIRSGYIADLLHSIYQERNDASIMLHSKVAAELKKTYQPLKKVIIESLKSDMVLPSLSQTLEYLKIMTIKEDLPTQFHEAQLDYFGKHMFDLRSDPPGQPVTGNEHFEWLPPKGKTDR